MSEENLELHVNILRDPYKSTHLQLGPSIKLVGGHACERWWASGPKHQLVSPCMEQQASAQGPQAHKTLGLGQAVASFVQPSEPLHPSQYVPTTLM